MLITGSPDISKLLVQVTFDLSGTNPIVSLVNKSVGNNLTGCSWAFTVINPMNTPIHEGDINNPDITGTFTTFELNDTWAKNPFNPNQIIWSGNTPYIFFVTVKDSQGNIYSTQDTEPQLANICPPPFVTDTHESNFGIAKSNISNQCSEGYIFFQDETDHFYKGMKGTLVSSTLYVTFPPDNTGEQSNPFSLLSYSTALVPMTVNSPNYIFTQNGVYDYDLGSYVHVRINYYLQASFGVWCGIDLLPLNNIINKYFYKIANNEFPDMASAQKRSLLILVEYSQIVAGIVQPLSGAIEIPNKIRKIEKLTGFECFDLCCGAKSGIIGSGGSSSVIGGYNFSINKLGGDINGTVTKTGNNIQFNLGDVKYIVDVTQNSPSDITAISFEPETSGDGYTKYFHLIVDSHELAMQLASVIGNDIDAFNAWNALFGGGGSNQNFTLVVDGGCVFQSTASCNYTFTLSNIPSSGSYAILSNMKVGTNLVGMNFAFNLTNLPALQTYLNGFGLGTFVVTNLGSGNISISTSNNYNPLISLAYKIAGLNYTADMSRTCIGYQQKDANDVIQSIINYICGLNDSQIETSQDYQIAWIDPTTGKQNITTINGGASLSTLISNLLNGGVSTIQYILGLGKVNCNSIQGLFPTSTNTMQTNDWLDGVKAGACARIYPMELLKMQLQTLLQTKDTDTITALCSLIQICASGQTCDNIDFSPSVIPYDSSCPVPYDFVYNFDGSNNLNITKVVFGNTPASSQPLVVQYKLHSASSYTSYGTVTFNTDGTPSTSIAISTSAGQIYDVLISNTCGSPADSVLKTVTNPN